MLQIRKICYGQIAENLMQQSKKQHALVIKQFKKPPVYTQFQIPQPQGNQVQIKVIASTINPSDRINAEGEYWRKEANFIGGFQGYGQVVKAGNEQGQKLIGKKVSFLSFQGAWCQYTVTSTHSVWEVDSTVPIQSAASGIVNPMTVIGIVDTYRKWSNRGATPKGLINTAAASALGRMLNKYCQRQNIPLLNIVRRKQQVKILQEQGAKNIISTGEQNWLQQYKQQIKTHGFNVFVDAIGGGEITDQLISNLPPLGQCFIYGKLCTDKLVISKPMIFSGGAAVSSFMLGEWLPTISKQQNQAIRDNFSSLLKNQLSTTSLKQIKLSQVPQEFKDSQTKATDGKFTIII